MTTTDWIIDIALVLIVFRQLREERITKATFIVPLAMITFAAKTYLHGIPTAGNDLVLIGMFAGIGAVFGLFGGLLTRVRNLNGVPHVKATAGAAALWVTSMGFRLAFAVWSSHPSGAAHLTRFSATHHITSGQAWVTALILMAFGEVVIRLGTIGARTWALSNHNAQAHAVSQGRTREYVMETAGRS